MCMRAARSIAMSTRIAIAVALIVIDPSGSFVLAQTSLGGPEQLPPSIAPTPPPLSPPANPPASSPPRMDYIPPMIPPKPAPNQPSTTGGLLLGCDRLHCRRLLLVGLEKILAAGSRSLCPARVRTLRTRWVRGDDVFRAGVRGTRDLHRKLPATTLEPVLYRGRLDLSRSAGRCVGAL